MTTATKTKLSEQIAQCVVIVARHFETTPSQVIGEREKGGNKNQWARQVLWFYLRQRGFSYGQIGKMWGRSDSAIGYGSRAGGVLLMDEDRKMLATLPKIRLRKYGK